MEKHEILKELEFERMRAGRERRECGNLGVGER
jgi:hypothetical protein